MSVVEPVIVPDALRPSQRGLAVPPTARRAVVRSALVARLCGAVHASMATIVAPAGYGKTTLLAQWAERDAREVLGVAFEPEDDDPDAVELLLRPIAEEPGLLALLDDVHVIRSPEAVDALARLLDHAPAGTTVALAGRSLPPLSLARVRAEGRLIEIATENLALTSREAESLLRLAKAPLSPAAAAGLGDRLEGWPAAIYLAALSLRERHTGRDARRRRLLPRRLPRGGVPRRSVEGPAPLRDGHGDARRAHAGTLRLSPRSDTAPTRCLRRCNGPASLPSTATGAAIATRASSASTCSPS